MIDPPPKKYGDMPYSSYVPDRLKNEYVFVSPDFHNCAFASTPNAYTVNKPICSLKQGDCLLFYATLDFKNEKGKPEDWINPDWGAYIVGFFKVDFIFKGTDIFIDDSTMDRFIEAFEEYDWYKIFINKTKIDKNNLKHFVPSPWIKGIKCESGLLEKAIPLSSPKDSQKWSEKAYELFRTSTGKRLPQKAIFQTVLTIEGENLDKLLVQCTLSKC